MRGTQHEICSLLQQLNLFTFVSLFKSCPVNKLLLSNFHSLHSTHIHSKEQHLPCLFSTAHEKISNLEVQSSKYAKLDPNKQLVSFGVNAHDWLL